MQSAFTITTAQAYSHFTVTSITRAPMQDFHLLAHAAADHMSDVTSMCRLTC